MNDDTSYYPKDGSYRTPEGTIYAQYLGNCPNPCRKYHISADPATAKKLADFVLPFLAKRKIFHKVVRSKSLYDHQMAGDQAGKFITLYMPSNVAHRNKNIEDLGNLLANLRKTEGIQPSPTIPRSRGYRHLFIEQPLDEEMFIYGGFICDPYE